MTLEFFGLNTRKILLKMIEWIIKTSSKNHNELKLKVYEFFLSFFNDNNNENFLFFHFSIMIIMHLECANQPTNQTTKKKPLNDNWTNLIDLFRFKIHVKYIECFVENKAEKKTFSFGYDFEILNENHITCIIMI